MLLALSQAMILIAAPLSASPPPTGHLPVVMAQTDPVKGIDTMGDKGRSGPDGWIQAPVSRDSSASGTVNSPGEKKPTQAPQKDVSKSASGQTMKPGDDPGTPVDAKAGSPGKASSN